MSILNIGVSAIAYPLYINFLGYEKYGVWLVLTTILSFASLGNIGIETAVMKLVAEEKGREDILGIQSYITTALAVLFMSGTIIFIILLIFKHPIASTFNLDIANTKMVLWLLPYIGVLCIYTFMIQVLQAALSGFGRMDITNYISTLSRAIQVFVSGILLAAGYGVKAMLIGNFASCAVMNLLTILYINRILKLKILSIANLSYYSFRNLIRFGGTIFSGTLISMLLVPFNKLMLSRYVGVSSLPVYEIANNASMSIRSLIEAGLRALLPEISNISSRMTAEAEIRIKKIYDHAIKIIVAYGTPLFGAMLLFAPLIFSTWFGKNFVEIMPIAFQLMLIGTYMSLLGVPAYYTLMGTNRATHCLVSHSIQALSNFIIILAIVTFTHTLDVQQVVLSVSLGMSLSSLYLISTMRIAIKNGFVELS